jgi:hypothetical protein
MEELVCTKSKKIDFDLENLFFFVNFYFSKFNLGCLGLAHKKSVTTVG